MSRQLQRTFKTFGLLSWRVVSGREVRGGTQRRVYDILKSQGFRETPWQYIFHGQTGGLVCETEGKNEIHVRFYDGRIFSEYERGRAYLSHFFGPRYNAERYLHKVLRPYLSDGEYEDLISLTNHHRLMQQERSYTYWNLECRVTPLRRKVRGAFSLKRLLSSCTVTWFGLAVSLLGPAAVLFYVSDQVALTLLVLAILSGLVLWLPRPADDV